MPNVILTSSFQTVARELREASVLPAFASVGFVTTAGDPYAERPWIDADRAALVGLGYEVVDVDLKHKTADALREELRGRDVLFVAGGNTTYLARHADASGFAEVVRELLAEGKRYVGSSAGSILAGPTVEPFADEDRAELPADFASGNPACLRLVDYVVLPHDQVDQFSAEHDRIIEKYGNRFAFVRLTDRDYRLETI